MLGRMGMVTPIRPGMALTSSKEVVVIDGEGPTGNRAIPNNPIRHLERKRQVQEFLRT